MKTTSAVLGAVLALSALLSDADALATCPSTDEWQKCFNLYTADGKTQLTQPEFVSTWESEVGWLCKHAMSTPEHYFKHCAGKDELLSASDMKRVTCFSTCEQQWWVYSEMCT